MSEFYEEKSPTILIGIFLGLLLTSLVIFPQSYCTNSTKDIPNELQPNILLDKSLIPHEPINVDGDSSFIDYGFLGNGTHNSPYIIEGFSVINSTYIEGIIIFNTTKHFIITNCYVEVNGEGIRVEDVANGTAVIANNQLKGCNSAGLVLVRADGTIVANNTGLKNQISLRISYSRGVYVYNNTFTGGSPSTYTCIRGISTLDCTKLFITNNTIDDFEENILMLTTTFSLIANNTILSSNGHGGIFLWYGCDYNLVINNTVLNNSFEDGIRLIRSNYNKISFNTVKNNTRYGCNLDDESENNTIHHNNFINNNNDLAQGYSILDSNTWYQVTINEGNYWSDWDGLNSYEITGSTSVDLYPLLSPAVMNWTGFQFSLAIDDIYEDNDCIEDAPEIPFFKTLQLIYNDVDFFQFIINATFNVKVIIEFNTYAIDLNFFLLPCNFTGSDDDILASSIEAPFQEIINSNALPPGVYYLLVECPDVSFNTIGYTMIVTLTGVPVISTLPGFIWILAAFVASSCVTMAVFRKSNNFIS
ncbi:MAG: right-handed parallel beta-helix repeat-containing protein [Candidatus Heimdallarchaeota archaeon]